MTEDTYAAFERATAMTVIKTGKMWWTQVRPYFYRPLLPFKKYDSKKTRHEFDRMGGYQHGVQEGEPNNSYLNPIIFDDLRNYDPESLRKGARGCLKKALNENLAVRRMTDVEEFSEQGYPAYLSFFNRTRYHFDTSRREKAGFRRWARGVLQFPEAVVLGAFRGEQLVSFEISCLVGDTLIIKTVVHSDAALKVGGPDLLLHYRRTMAASCPEIRFMFDSLLVRDQGVNEFKLSRGAKILSMPSYVHLRPAFLWLMRNVSKSTYARIAGYSADELLALRPPRVVVKESKKAGAVSQVR